MKFWGPAIVGFLLAVVPAQAGVKLPAVEDHLSLYEKQLIAKANQDTRPSIELLRQVRSALAAGKTSSAIDALEILAGKHNAGGEGGFGTWLKLALAYQARMTNEAKSLALSDGTAAAYGAYKRADTDPDRIAALSALGSLLLRATALEETEGESPEEKSAEELATEQTPADKQNREAARAMAYTVFTELGHLVADDRYQATLEKLEPKFRLEKATYPPRPDQYSPRNFSAWIGLVPKQHSSGGKDKLDSISKQGDRYLRSLFTAGALAVIRYAKIHGTQHRPWLTALLTRRPTKVAAIALANKIARMAWAKMAKGERYREPVALAA